MDAARTIDPETHKRGWGRVAQGDDAGCRVEFSRGEVETDGGKLVEKEFIRISFPGDKLAQVYRQVEPRDRERFAAQYLAFQSGQGFNAGTPIEEAPFLPAEVVKTLKKFDIDTVEQFAAVNDHNLIGIRIPNAQGLRTLAQSFLTRGPEREQADARALEAENTALKEQMAERDARMDKLEAMMLQQQTASAGGKPAKQSA